MANFIGVDLAGVQSWKARLDAKHEAVVAALQDYRTTALANNEVAHGSHFTRINGECDQITSKHLTDHNQLHTEYSTASSKLTTGVEQVAGA
jgi:hypothetical protein